MGVDVAALPELLRYQRSSVKVRGRPGVFGGEFEGFELPQRYALEGDEALGWGAHGCVCAGVDTRTGGKVAVKKLKDVFSSRQRAKATIREIALLRHFTKNVERIYDEDDGSHDNIVRLLDVLIPVGNPEDSSVPLSDRRYHYDDVYIVLERYDVSLKRLIAQHFRMTETHRALFCYQLLRGLKTVHSAGCAHRDLKPDNLLVRREENTYFLALCDMGSGRGVTPGDIFLTNTNCVTSSWYVPPEGLAAEGLESDEACTPAPEVLQAIDMWSVGCILAEMILGRELFRDTRGAAFQLRRIAGVLGSPPDSFASFCPEGVMPSVVQQARSSVDLGVDDGEELPAVGVASYIRALQQQGRLLGDPPSDIEIDILSKMLQWDPRERISVDSAISHEYFSRPDFDYHNSEDEPLATVFSLPDTAAKLLNERVEESEEAADKDKARAILWEAMLEYHPELRASFE